MPRPLPGYVQAARANKERHISMCDHENCTTNFCPDCGIPIVVAKAKTGFTSIVYSTNLKTLADHCYQNAVTQKRMLNRAKARDLPQVLQLEQTYEKWSSWTHVLGTLLAQQWPETDH